MQMRLSLLSSNVLRSTACGTTTGPIFRAGVRQKIVQERLRHSRIGITLDTCSSSVLSLQATAVRAMNVAFQDRSWIRKWILKWVGEDGKLLAPPMAFLYGGDAHFKGRPRE
jgi:hypothetical protein